MEFYRNYPIPVRDNMLWHYTSPEVLWKMLEGNFYATHYRFMNDSAEILYGLNIFKSFFQKAAADNQTIANTLMALAQKDFFLMCFSNKEDDLYQWRSYAGDGGFAIGFSEQEIHTLIAEYYNNNPANVSLDFKLLPCKYLKRDRINRYFRYLSYKLFGKSYELKDFVSEDTLSQTDLEQELRQTLPQEYKNQNPWKVLLDFTNAFTMNFSVQKQCSIIKNPSFSAEEEVRLIVTGNNLRNQINLIGDKPRIALPFKLQNCIKSVYVSPHGETDRNLVLAEIARDKFGLNFEIKESSSSYNGRR